MSFKSVLKIIEEGVLKTGAVVAQVEGIEPIIAPLIALASPGAAATVAAVQSKVDVTLTDLTSIVKQVQVIGTQSGMTADQKLAAEAALAGQMLQAFGHITDKNIGDPAEVTAGVTDLMAAVVRIQKALKA